MPVNIINKLRKLSKCLSLLLIMVLVSCSANNDAAVSVTKKEENKLHTCLSKLNAQLDKSKLVNFHNRDESIDNCESIVFGKYEIDGNLSNGLEDIEWVLLDYDEENKKALLTSKYILDCKAYFDHIYVYQKNYDEVKNMLTADEINSWDADADELRNLIFSKYGEYLKDLTWENSTLREWLNKEFYETSFDKYEKSMIKLTDIKTVFKNNNDLVEIKTEDNVFCLDIDELKKYMHYVTNLEAKNLLAGTSATPFAKKVANFAEGIRVEKDGDWYNRNNWYKGMSNYWLRNRNEYGDPSTARVVLPVSNFLTFVGSGKYYDYEQVDKRNVGVRPAIYIDLNENSVVERYNNLEEKTENIIHFDERMFKNEKTDKIAETTIAEEDIEYYYSGGKWD